MKFLIDAQLPRWLARWLQEAGHDALHTLDLPDGNRTTDAEINARAACDSRVVITKDADFIDSRPDCWSSPPTISRTNDLRIRRTDPDGPDRSRLTVRRTVKLRL